MFACFEATCGVWCTIKLFELVVVELDMGADLNYSSHKCVTLRVGSYACRHTNASVDEKITLAKNYDASLNIAYYKLSLPFPQHL